MTSRISDQTLGSARARLRDVGARVTTARVRVLAALTTSGRPLLHHDVEHALSSGANIDRVTLYRVLDWLVEQGLAHRVAGSDRAWRFSVVGDVARKGGHGELKVVHDRHAHFHCNACGKVYCLDKIGAKSLKLPVPRGYRPEAVELTVKGQCARCR